MKKINYLLWLLIVFMFITNCSQERKEETKDNEISYTDTDTNSNIIIKEIAKKYIEETTDFFKTCEVSPTDDILIVTNQVTAVLKKENDKYIISKILSPKKLQDIQFSKDGKYFFAFDEENKAIKIYTVADDFKIKKEIKVEERAEFAVGKKFLAIANSNTLKLYSLSDLNKIKEIPFDNEITKLSFFKKYDNLLVVTQRPITCYILQENNDFSIAIKKVSYYSSAKTTGAKNVFTSSYLKTNIFKFENDTLKKIAELPNDGYFSNHFIAGTDTLIFSHGFYEILNDSLIKIKDLTPHFDKYDITYVTYSIDGRYIALQAYNKIYLYKNLTLIDSVEFSSDFSVSSIKFSYNNKNLFVCFHLKNEITQSYFDSIVNKSPAIMKIFSLKNGKLKEAQQFGNPNKIMYFQIAGNYFLAKKVNNIHKIFDIDRNFSLVDTIHSTNFFYLDPNFNDYLIEKSLNPKYIIYKLSKGKRKPIASESQSEDNCNFIVGDIRILPHKILSVEYFIAGESFYTFSKLNPNMPDSVSYVVLSGLNYKKDTLYISVITISDFNEKIYKIAGQFKCFSQNENLVVVCTNNQTLLYYADTNNIQIIDTKQFSIINAECNPHFIAVEIPNKTIKIFSYGNKKITEKYTLNGTLIDLGDNNILEIKTKEGKEFYYLGETSAKKVNNIKQGKTFFTKKYLVVLDANDTLHFYKPVKQ